MDLVKVLVEAGAKIHAKIEHGQFTSVLHASQSKVSLEDRERYSLEERSEKALENQKAEVAEWLQRQTE